MEPRKPRVVVMTCRPPFIWSAEFASDEEMELLYGRDNRRFHKLRMHIPESVSRHDLREAVNWLRAFIPEPETEAWAAQLMDSPLEPEVPEDADSRH